MVERFPGKCNHAEPQACTHQLLTWLAAGRYQCGAELLDLCAEASVPACLLFRRVLEGVCPALTRKVCIYNAGSLLRHTFCLPTAC